YAKHLWVLRPESGSNQPALRQLIRQLVAHQDSAGQSGGSMTANSPPTVANAALPDAALGGGAAGSGGGQQQSALNTRRMIKIFSCLPPEQWRGGLFGAEDQIVQAVNDMDCTRIDWRNWLLVIQQMLARIDSRLGTWSMLKIVNILVEVGKAHPQAMNQSVDSCASNLAALSVGAGTATKFCTTWRATRPRLVSEGFMLNEELIRLAITWAEMVADAGRFCSPLHELMTEAARDPARDCLSTRKYARELQECLELCAPNISAGRHMQELNVAWDIYYNIFRRLGKQLSSTPGKLPAQTGNWPCRAPLPAPKARLFALPALKPTLKLINSKQKPRILTVNGSDGHGYTVLIESYGFERRTNYIRSLATMSMVGYILGLAIGTLEYYAKSRHWQNCSHRFWWTCFEVAMHREKFPTNRCHFRLTRMLIKALEVTGIEGCFRQTCI
uniref:PI3K/PI4K catalytic domain-containing protein n=1 Tax=Macrostomum lignano TaxID=282301 RepID=A0A1I8FRZ5_9PLAT